MHGIKPCSHSATQDPREKTSREDLQTKTTSVSVNTNASTSGSTSLNNFEEGNVITTMFIPVIFSRKDCSNIETRVYGLIDDDRDSTFVIDSFL